MVCAILFSSCSSKFGLMKRRYTKGYHVEIAKHHKHKQASSKEDRQHKAVIKQQNSENVRVYAPAGAENIQHSEKSTVLASAPVQIPAQTHKKNTRLSASRTPIHEQPSTVRSLPDNFVAEKNTWRLDTGNRSAEGVNEVLLLILCILLPPVAVFLFHGALTTDFWVSLLLTILFFLPGIVFALLVCFAGVSLN